MSNKPTVGNAASVIETTIAKNIIEDSSEKLLDRLQVDVAIAGTGLSAFVIFPAWRS